MKDELGIKMNVIGIKPEFEEKYISPEGNTFNNDW